MIFAGTEGVSGCGVWWGGGAVARHKHGERVLLVIGEVLAVRLEPADGPVRVVAVGARHGDAIRWDDHRVELRVHPLLIPFPPRRSPPPLRLQIRLPHRRSNAIPLPLLPAPPLALISSRSRLSLPGRHEQTARNRPPPRPIERRNRHPKATTILCKLSTPNGNQAARTETRYAETQRSYVSHRSGY